MSKAFCIGNGESRKGVNLDALRKFGKIYGCNAMYREYTPDVLVAVDQGIIHEIYHSGYAYENKLAYASYDSYPVSKHHCLVIPKRHIKDYFDLSDNELLACNELIKILKKEIINKDPSVKGFNLGTNIGKVSGQSILHCHFHLIPRRDGDVDNPQGGVRSVIPNKQHYKRKK